MCRPSRPQPSSGSRPSVRHDGVRFDFDQHVRIDEAAHFDNRGRRGVLSEHLLMRPAEFLPSLDIGNEHPGAYYMPELGPLRCKGVANAPLKLRRNSGIPTLNLFGADVFLGSVVFCVSGVLFEELR